MPDDDKRAAEIQLLRNLRTRRAELSALMEECSSHWGFEDPVYRFYHQSFKVYAVQDETVRIVDLLQRLAPDRPLHPSFREIIGDGTGRIFNARDNADWTAAIRPILEAFFHARFFLDMAVRYSGTLEPPPQLPSGYAALLYLYGLR